MLRYKMAMSAAGAGGGGESYDDVILGFSPDFYYKLDETNSDTTCADSSGNSNTGRVSNTVNPVTAQNFVSGSGIVTDGGTSYDTGGGELGIVLDNSKNYNPSDFSIVIWAEMPVSIANLEQLISKWEASNDTFSFNRQTSSGGQLQFNIRTGSGTNQNMFYSGTEVDDGNNHLWVITVSTTNNRMYMYVDNGVIASSNLSISSSYDTDTVQPWIIGNWDEINLAVSYTGAIDNVAIIPSELTQANVQSIYAAGTA